MGGLVEMPPRLEANRAWTGLLERMMGDMMDARTTVALGALLTGGALISLTACEGSKAGRVKDPPPLLVEDTGAPCDAPLNIDVPVTPADGASAVYWRDAITLTFDADASQTDITLADAAGAEVETALSWDASRMNVTVLPALALAPNTTYGLTVFGCGNDAVYTFTTAEWGEPLDIAPIDLVGRVYNFDLAGADYAKPEGLGTLLGLYLTEPLLFQITDVTTGGITLMGAQGMVDGTSGEIVQNRTFSTWDFGQASFSDAPFFGATTAGIAIDYADSVIPMHNFHVEGTFAADGSMIGGGVASGHGDTRDMGPLLQLGGDPNAVCDFASGLGLDCVDCPDGNPWCLEIEAHFDDAEWLEDLDLREIR
jgi:hypothetical protein